MKILHVINTLSPAGAEILLSVIAPAIKKKGLDIEISTIYKYENKSLYDTLRRENIVVHSLDFSFRYDPRIYRALKKLTYAGNYDIIHAHLFPALYWTALCGPRCKKLIVSEHSSYNTRRSSVVFKIIERFIYKRYSLIFCISNSVKAALSQWLPEYGNKMVTIYNGIDLDKFAQALPLERAAIGLPESGHVAAMVSRIDLNAKDHKTIIWAATAFADLYVLFIGGGERLDVLQALARHLNVEDRIRFLGYRSDIPSLLRLCDVYIHSSNWEGFGLAVVEAMACGIPVIASDIEGLNEVIRNGESGLLFKKGDSGDLAEKIRVLLDDKALIERLKKGGLARARDFSVSATVDKFISWYRA